MKPMISKISRNLRMARQTWGPLDRAAIESLRNLTRRYRFSVESGDLRILGGHWYVTHSGLLSLANRRRCSAIRVQQVRAFCDPAAARWVFKATILKADGGSGFVGYGDADPSNVSPLVHGAEMRVAETRAVNRALRKAYGIGLCSVEELGWTPRSDSQSRAATATNNGNGNGKNFNHPQPRLRDRLCLLIRQHRLDPTLVKSYAAEFCGTSTLRDAGRERLEEFVNRLAEQAATDRDGLICQLNSFQPSQDVQS